MDKHALRRYIREQKRAMSHAQIDHKSTQLLKMLTASEAYRSASVIYGYMSFNQEVRTLPILEQALRDGKQLAIPKCRENELCFIYMDDLSKVNKGYSGIPEPIADAPVARDTSALVLVPGLAFDSQGNRIGYGGGFYDRFLAREPNHPTIALCYDFQMFPFLETEEFDIPVDLVLWA